MRRLRTRHRRVPAWVLASWAVGVLGSLWLAIACFTAGNHIAGIAWVVAAWLAFALGMGEVRS